MSDIIKKYFFAILGILITAVSYNLFFLPYDLVVYDMSGLSIIYENIFKSDARTFIFIAEFLCLIFGFIVLGFKDTKCAILGSILYPLFVFLTKDLSIYFSIDGADKLIVAVVAGITCGFGNGLIFKYGFNTGGTDIIEMIVCKFLKISFGTAVLLIDGAIVLVGGFIFGYETLVYAIIALLLISIVSDKILLGINKNKTFYVISNKEKEIRDFLFDNFNLKVKILKTRGAFTLVRKEMIVFSIQNREYYSINESIKHIDKDAFIIITNAREVVKGLHYKKFI